MNPYVFEVAAEARFEEVANWRFQRPTGPELLESPVAQAAILGGSFRRGVGRGLGLDEARFLLLALLTLMPCTTGSAPMER